MLKDYPNHTFTLDKPELLINFNIGMKLTILKFEEKEHLYKRRQAIVEHHYGTLKRQWGFSYILTKKGISRASSDVGFMFIAYNLRRFGNILTRDRLREYLRILFSLFSTISDLIRDQLRQISEQINDPSFKLD